MKKALKIPHEEKLVEAIRRMELLELSEEIKKDFVEREDIPLFARGMEDALHLHKNQENRITAFEDSHNALVYAVIFTPTSLGDMESYLFVSDWEEEWEMDRQDILEGYPMTWTENLTYPQCSEFGSICFERTASGGIIRVS